MTAEPIQAAALIAADNARRHSGSSHQCGVGRGEMFTETAASIDHKFFERIGAGIAARRKSVSEFARAKKFQSSENGFVVAPLDLSSPGLGEGAHPRTDRARQL